jgi:4-hydroxybenzoate polyprenyltransferase
LPETASGGWTLVQGSFGAGVVAPARSWLRSIRVFEALFLQAFPVLGLLQAGRESILAQPLYSGWLLVCLGLLYAHVFALNDWANIEEDVQHPTRASATFLGRGVSRSSMRNLAIVLGLAALGGLALLSARIWPYALCLLAASTLYSHPRLAWKRVPLASSALHLLSGTAHFLAGRALLRPLDAGSLALGWWCGVIFAAGHLVQEVEDHDADRRSGVMTNAVRFGKRRTFVAAFLAFAFSFVLLACMAGAGILPSPVWGLAVLYPPLALVLLQALRRGLDAAAVARARRRYRALFAVLAIALGACLWAA